MPGENQLSHDHNDNDGRHLAHLVGVAQRGSGVGDRSPAFTRQHRQHHTGPDDETVFLEQAIEAWSAVCAGDSDIEARRADRFNVKRKLAGKYTDAEREEVGSIALSMIPPTVCPTSALPHE